MWRTRVGYAGSDSQNPTYKDMRGHTECVQVDYDPTVVSYAELVDLVLGEYNAASSPTSGQYAHVVLASDAEELEIARERARAMSEKRGRPVVTRIDRLDRFWPAEDYHQKWYLRRDGAITAEFRAMLGDDEEALRESTSAMKVNGYLAGSGTQAQLAREIDQLGLSDDARARLKSRVRDTAADTWCPVP